MIDDQDAAAESAEATAYHEAGHAVIALLLGRPIHKVSIRPDREKLGYCAFRKGVQRPSDDWLEQEMLIALAGLAAEAKHTGIYAWAGAGHDLRWASKLASQRAGERQAERLLKRMLSKVENELHDEGIWAAVELVAAELLKATEISGRAARHFFERHVR